MKKLFLLGVVMVVSSTGCASASAFLSITESCSNTTMPLVDRGLTSIRCVTLDSAQPVPQEIKTTETFNHSFEHVWDRSLDFFLENDISISTIEKDSGIIVSENFRLGLNLAANWLDCGSYQDQNNLIQWATQNRRGILTSYNISIRPATDGVTLRVRLHPGTASYDSLDGEINGLTCYSNGSFEQLMFDYINR